MKGVTKAAKVVGTDVQFVCPDGTVRKESPRGPIVRRVQAEKEGR